MKFLVSFFGFLLVCSTSVSAAGLAIVASISESNTHWVFNNSSRGVTIDPGIRVMDAAQAVTYSGTADVGYVVYSNYVSSDLLLYTTTAGFTVSGPTTLTKFKGVNGTFGKWSITGTGKTGAEWQAFFRTFRYSSSSASFPTHTTSVAFSIGEDSSYFDPDSPSGTGHFYLSKPTTGSWGGDRTNAATFTKYGMTGYMATISSNPENSFLVTKQQGNTWHSASDENSEGTFQYFDGPETGQTVYIANGVSPWGVGEPNDSNGEDYAFMMNASNGQWNDEDPGFSGYYFLEFGGNGPANVYRTGDILLKKVNANAVGFGAIF